MQPALKLAVVALVAVLSCSMDRFTVAQQDKTLDQRQQQLNANKDDDEGNANNVPALFVFGDSIVDTGNNNHLFTLARANYRPYGIDFVDGIPTGRFADGLLPVDYLAILLGLPLVPPYLDGGDDILHGVCFASAGSGVLENTGHSYGQHIPLSAQIDNFVEVKQRLYSLLGEDAASVLVSKSLYLIVIGSNDFFDNYIPTHSIISISYPNDTSEVFPPYFEEQLLSQMIQQLQRLYDLGARKIITVGVPALGCVPYMLNRNQGQCASLLNDAVQRYNSALKQNIMSMRTSLQDAHLVYANSFDLAQRILANFTAYGFKDNQTACCGWGAYGGALPCTPVISNVCTNASENVFWDYVHPCSTAYHIVVRQLWNGPQDVIDPVNLQQLRLI
ncbi:hypothetical protein KP509_10G073800 [Ceratopteris richardii]|uniref:GDSL esterase/lipase n=1 Tax=Ceratopteris richardii TaxID=49495 RepID=A0A8T2TYQ0_CERRI|nr:hypothetical protein KP509_10G073800 [Ceratopteris richardii]KAH7428062.1 hypothetical protein KP509_10G073800 [Ceratopteris richardii]